MEQYTHIQYTYGTSQLQTLSLQVTWQYHGTMMASDTMVIPWYQTLKYIPWYKMITIFIYSIMVFTQFLI